MSCSLGSYDTQLEAAVAYDLMATALFGAAVMTNLDPSTYKPVPPQVMTIIAQAFASNFRGARKEGREALRRLVGWQLPSVLRHGPTHEY